MKKQILLITLIGISVSVFSQSFSRQEKYVLDLSKRKFEWLVDKNYDSLLTLLDDKAVYTHSNGWSQNKKTLIEDLQSGKLAYSGITVKESGVRIYNNNTAIITGIGVFSWLIDGKEASTDLGYTEVYIKSGSRWKLASRHANKMQ